MGALRLRVGEVDLFEEFLVLLFDLQKDFFEGLFFTHSHLNDGQKGVDVLLFPKVELLIDNEVLFQYLRQKQGQAQKVVFLFLILSLLGNGGPIIFLLQ